MVGHRLDAHVFIAVAEVILSLAIARLSLAGARYLSTHYCPPVEATDCSQSGPPHTILTQPGTFGRRPLRDARARCQPDCAPGLSPLLSTGYHAYSPIHSESL